MRTAINFIYQCKFSNKAEYERDEFRNKSLSQFLNTYKLNEAAKQIRDEARIKHILHLYEEIEKDLLDSLVERVHQKYREPITEVKKK